MVLGFLNTKELQRLQGEVGNPCKPWQNEWQHQTSP